MWKAFLHRRARFALPEGGGLWLGDQAYAVWFPMPTTDLPCGRIVGRIGQAVVDEVVVEGDRLRLLLDEGQAQVVVRVVPDPEALSLAVRGERVGAVAIAPLAQLALRTIRVAGQADRVQLVLRPGEALAVVDGQIVARVRVRGELSGELTMPAHLPRLAWWAGLREGECAIELASDRVILRSWGEAGRVYRFAAPVVGGRA